jgi:hypothetical protein
MPSTAVPMERLPLREVQAERLPPGTSGAKTGVASPSPNRLPDTRSPHSFVLKPQDIRDEVPRLRLPSAQAKKSISNPVAVPLQGVGPGQAIDAAQALAPGSGARSDLHPEGPSRLPVLAAPQAHEPVEGQAGPDYPAGDPSILPETTLSLEGGVDTQLAGVLYLINLMAQLDLPGCFENDWNLASQVGAWAVLETLARGLLGKDGGGVSRDPIWPALAQLDGREPATLPGVGFRGGACFCLPAHWLTHVAPAERKLFDQAPLADLRGSLAEGLNPGLSRWLAFVLPYIRLRLRRALHPSVAETFNLQEALLLRQGRLYVTSTHVDLVMSLRDVSVPIRMAGLDCNPGWLPDFGRVISFHFE